MHHNNIILTVVIILAAAGLAYGIIKGKYPALLLPLTLLFGAFLRVICSWDAALHQWDECYHALVAKNLSDNWILPVLYPEPILPYDYKDWSANYIWMHKPPLALWMMALSVKVFGSYALSVRIPSILFSIVTGYLVYLIGIKIVEKKQALLATYLFCINGFIIDLCSGRTATDHVDTLFVCLMALGVFLALRDGTTNNTTYRYAVLVGIVAGLAVLTKWLVGMFIVFMYAVVLMRYKRKVFVPRIALTLVASLVVFMPWNVYAYIHYETEFVHEQIYNISHVNEGLEGHDQPFWYFLDRARINWNELIYLHVLIFGYAAARRKEAGHLILLIWLVVPYVLFSMVSTKMPAYVAICAPAIFCMIAYAVFQIKHPYARNIILIATIALAIRYSVERIKPMERFGGQNTIVQLPEFDKDSNKRIVLFGCQDPIQTMYFYDVVAYARYPTVEELERINKANTQLVAYGSPDLPDYIRHDSTILKVEAPLPGSDR
jgi:4-amino-4-deoxy-L-arabinose transferase-like glycosyltransferase